MKKIIFIIFILYCYPLFGAEDEHITKYLEIINKEPGNYQAYNKVGLFLVKMSNYNKAEEYFKNAIILNNNYYEGFYNLGSLYYQMNIMDKALENFKRAYIINNNEVDLYTGLINTSLKLNKLMLAKIYMDKGLERFKETDHKLLNSAGVVELLFRNYEKAKNYFEAALKVNDSFEIKNNLAITEYEMGNKDKAKELLKDRNNKILLINENYKLIK